MSTITKNSNSNNNVQKDLFHPYLTVQWYCFEEKEWIPVELIFDPHGVRLDKIPVSRSTISDQYWGEIYCRLAGGGIEPIESTEQIITISTRFELGELTTINNTIIHPDYTLEELKQCTIQIKFYPNIKNTFSSSSINPSICLLFLLESNSLQTDFLADASQFLSVCAEQCRTQKMAQTFQLYKLAFFNNRCRVTLFRKNGWRDIMTATKNMEQLICVREAYLYFQPHRTQRGGIIYCCDKREFIAPFQYVIFETMINVNDIRELCFGQHFLEFQTMAALDKLPAQCFTLVQQADGRELHVSMSDDICCRSLLKHLTDFCSQDLHKKIQTDTNINK